MEYLFIEEQTKDGILACWRSKEGIFVCWRSRLKMEYLFVRGAD